MARQPKPTALKVLLGNPGNRPLPVEPKYEKLPVEPPVELDPACHQYWRKEIVPLIYQGVATTADFGICVDYCWFRYRVEQLKLQIEKDGEIITNKNGDKQRHPAQLAISNYQGVVDSMRIQLGMTAVSRSRVKGNEESKNDQKENVWDE